MASRSMLAEMLFMKLILEADDYGRMDGRLQWIKSRAFPMRPEVTLESIEEWVTELSTGSDAPLQRYQVDGDEFICFVNWEKHRSKSRRASESRLPGPPPHTEQLNLTESKPTEGIPGDPGDQGDPLGVGGGVGSGVGGGLIADAPTPPPVDPYRLPPDTPTLTDAQIQKLIATKPHGVVHSPHDVACWFAEKEPRMRAAGKKSMPRTATAWWGRLKPGEVNESKEWVKMVNARASGARMKAEEALRPPPREYTAEEIEAVARRLEPQRQG